MPDPPDAAQPASAPDCGAGGKRPLPLALPRPRARDCLDILLFSALVACIGWLILRGAEGLGYNWQWYQVPRAVYSLDDSGFQPGPLLLGLGVTLQLTALSFLGALLVGLAAALLRLSGSLAGRALGRAYLELIRNTPLLIQLLFLYFAVAPVLGLDALATAVLGLSLFEGAYVCEIIRAGVLSIDPGQWDAARSLGMGTADAYRHVILPQALRRMLPPLASQAVTIVKDSSLASAIAIAELTLRGQTIVAETFLSFEIWFTVAALYLIVTTALSAAAHALERRLAYPA